jgi:drug/metabolite transporter (DMT)-like permease
MTAATRRDPARIGMPRFLERRPGLVLAAVTLLWGSTFVITKDVIRSLAPLPYLIVRFTVGALVLGAIFPRALRPSRITVRDGALLGLGQALGLLLQVFGQVYTTATKSAFGTSLATALTPVGALLLYGEPPRRQQVAGVALATVGLYALTVPVGGVAWNRGDLFTVGCATVYAWVIVETARRAPRSPIGPLTAIQTGFAALTFTVLCALTHLGLARLDPSRLAAFPAWAHLASLERRPFHLLHLGARASLELAYMALVCTVVTFLGQTWAMSRMSATRAAVLFALEPVFATGLAIAVEGGTEWLPARGAVGAVLILAGVLASEMRWRPRVAGPEVVRSQCTAEESANPK